ncbi:MAG TPA: LysR family transcriptional regulator [Xanthobacteraceae bacterium]|jgi:DNA-binding transcriptional LysR family regulator
MQMHQVRYFLVLAEERNFTRSASRCNVTQPSLTRAIKMLEEELGGALFHRDHANTRLTDLGKLVQPHLEEVYRGAENARRKAREFTEREVVPLRVGLMCTIAPTQLLDFVHAVQLNHPMVRLQIIDDTAAKLQDDLRAGDLDVAIYATPMVPPDPHLHYLPLYRERYVIVLRPDHRLAGGKAICVRDLNGECYLSRINCEYDAPATRIFEEQRADCETVYESERDDWILAMAAAGLGFGFMPELSARHPGVVALPLIEPEFWREVALVTVRGRPYSAAAGSLVREAMRKRWNGKPALAVAAMQGESVHAAKSPLRRARAAAAK